MFEIISLSQLHYGIEYESTALLLIIFFTFDKFLSSLVSIFFFQFKVMIKTMYTFLLRQNNNEYLLIYILL